MFFHASFLLVTPIIQVEGSVTRPIQNMRKYISLIVCILCLSLLVSFAEAKNSVDITLVGAGVRPMGLGKAYTAVSDDTNAVFANPAGLGLQKAWGITSMTTKLLERVDYKLVGAVYPTTLGTIGFGYLCASTPAGYLTTDKASITSAQAITYSSSMIVLSYGKEINELIKVSNSIGKLGVGANLKAVSNSFGGTDASGSGTTLDLGILYRPNANISLGLNLQNLSNSVAWKSGTTEKLARAAILGGAYNFDKGLATVDLELGASAPLLHGGVEYRPQSTLAFRVGVDQSMLSQTETAVNLTGGLGFKVNGIGFDYAYRQDSSLGDNSTHYFSVSIQPGPSGRLMSAADDEVVKATDREFLDGLFKTTSLSRAKVKASVSDASAVTSQPAQKDILHYYE